MLKLTNVSLDHGRIKENIRFRLCGPRPVFSWGAVSDLSASKQSECRIKINCKDAEWDSGWVKTEKQSLRYTGAPLPEGEEAEVRIIIRDDKGNESDPFITTVYNAYVDWQAGWIGLFKENNGETVYIRREFTVSKPLKNAVLYVCGLGWQKPYLNGETLDNAFLDPANTDYSVQCQYVVYPDLKNRLKPGENCLGVMLGSGWRHNSVLEWDYQDDRIHNAGPVQLSAMLRLTYTDGETEWLFTDEKWEAGRGAIRNSDIFDGEIYDARENAVGWNTVGFRSFSPALSLPAPGGRMEPMLIPPITEHETRKPIASWCIGDGRFIYDFGQNIAGVLRVYLPKSMKAGQSLKLTHAEELDEDGTLYTEPLRAAMAEDTYIASGDEHDLCVWQPLFTYHGFRYAQIEGDITPVSVEAIELHTDLEIYSHFRCGDALLTKIHEICVATERANQHSILTDCPQRDERQGWMNDATVRFEETPYNFDIGRIFPKIMRDVADEQSPDGSVADTAPFIFGARPADPVCSSFLVAGLEAWVHTGNLDVINKHFDDFAAWENYLLDHSDNYIVNYSYYGDWAGPSYACESEEIPRSAVTPGVFMSTGYSYFNCRSLALFSAALGRTDDEKKWRQTAENIRASMLEKWYDKETAKICTGSQAAQAFALWLGIIPDDDIQKAVRLIHDELVQNGYMLTTGNLCSRYLLDVLTQNGYVDDAFALLTRTEYPSFGYEIEQEATTVWERFELKKNPGMNSHNHPMYGAADYWFWAYLCGIKPTAPGFEHVRIEPYFPEKLMSAQATLDTVRGDISVHWVKRYGKLILQVSIPFGTETDVVFDGRSHTVKSGFHVFEKPL